MIRNEWLDEYPRLEAMGEFDWAYHVDPTKPDEAFGFVELDPTGVYTANVWDERAHGDSLEQAERWLQQRHEQLLDDQFLLCFWCRMPFAEVAGWSPAFARRVADEVRHIQRVSREEKRGNALNDNRYADHRESVVRAIADTMREADRAD